MRRCYPVIAAAGLLAAWGSACYLLNAPQTVSAAQQHSSFNAGPQRAVEDTAAVAHGKALYAISCQACHGSDLRGGDMGGPNLLRSQEAMTDQHGEHIIPIIQGTRTAQGMPNIGLNNDDAAAVAAYVRSVVGMIGSQGRPPGEREVKEPDIIVGDPEKGKAYFATNCAKCHSATGDLKDYATRFKDNKRLQADWVAGGLVRASQPPATVEVTTAPGKVTAGTLVRADDFVVTVKLADGSERSFARHGTVPQVVFHNPLQWHRDMLPQYKDSDIHDLTAYLVTLK